MPIQVAEEAAIVVEAWTEALTFAGVPIERLNECYLTALTTKEDNYPLGVSPICTAWAEIQQEEAAIAERARVKREQAERDREMRGINARARILTARTNRNLLPHKDDKELYAWGRANGFAREVEIAEGWERANHENVSGN